MRGKTPEQKKWLATNYALAKCTAHFMALEEALTPSEKLCDTPQGERILEALRKAGCSDKEARESAKTYYKEKSGL